MAQLAGQREVGHLEIPCAAIWSVDSIGVRGRATGPYQQPFSMCFFRDWCISRQIWWGQRIPAYKFFDDRSKHETWIAAKSSDEALVKLKKKLDGVAHQGRLLVKQDADVLDTWFSSALIPFAYQGWPNEVKLLCSKVSTGLTPCLTLNLLRNLH